MRWVRDFLKEVVQLVTPKAVSAAMAAWIMACRICFQVIFFELFIGIFVLKDLFFSVIPDKDEESVGIKMIAFRFFTLFRTTVSFQKDKSLRKYRSTSEQPFHFRKTNTIRLQKSGKFRRFLPSCHPVRKPLPSSPQCFSPLSGL